MGAPLVTVSASPEMASVDSQIPGFETTAPFARAHSHKSRSEYFAAGMVSMLGSRHTRVRGVPLAGEALRFGR